MDKEKKKIILIAEDDEAISKAVSYLLKSANYVTVPIVDGKKIIDRVKKILPDIHLLDVSMVGEDGRDVCKELKKDKQMKRIPIIMMSAHNNLRKMAKEAGADDYLTKPFNITELLQKIEKTHRLS